MEKLLSIAEIADLLGISRCTVYKYSALKKLPLVKIGTRSLGRPSEIQAWLDEHATTIRENR